MTFRTLFVRTWRDSLAMLASCAAFAALFVALRVFGSSKIELDQLLLMVTESLKFVENLLPVSIADLTSPLGRSAFSFEEMPLLLAASIWGVARGTDCVAGRTAAGTMEMLLAQPASRSVVMWSHVTATLAGAVVLAIAAWGGIAAGLAWSSFEDPPRWTALAPAVGNFLALQTFVIGASVLSGALLHSRGAAMGVVAGLALVELAILVVSRLLPNYPWLGWLTILSVYQPTKLAVTAARDPAAAAEAAWQFNMLLVAIGAAMLLAATTLFNRRDVPAP